MTCFNKETYALLKLGGHQSLPFAAENIILQQQLSSFSHHPCEKPIQRRKPEPHPDYIISLGIIRHHTQI